MIIVFLRISELCKDYDRLTFPEVYPKYYKRYEGLSKT